MSSAPKPPRRLPISPRTLGLIFLVVLACLAPLLPPLTDQETERPRSRETSQTQSPTSTTRTREPQLNFTKHGRERFEERQISEDDAIAVIDSPDRQEHEKPGEDGGEVYKYTGRVEGRTLVIVAETQGERHTIITGYWDD